MPALTFEAEITPGMRAAQVAELARLAEEAGFDRVGISDVVFWPDPFVLLGVVASATRRVRIGPMVTNPYTRHPAVLAGAIAAVHDASDGRAFLGIGVGAGLEPLGETYPRPVRRLREAIEAIAWLLTGEEVHLEGETLRIDGARMTGPVAPVPIAIGTRSPQVIRLAGEVADIALLGGRYLSPALVADWRTWLAEGADRVGRDVAEVEVAPRLTLCVSRDGDHARRSVKRYVAHYVALLRPADLDLDPAWLARVEAALARSDGWYFATDRRDDPEIDTLIGDDLVRRFAIAGAPDECADLARAALGLGFTAASMNLAAPLGGTLHAGLRETLEGAGDVLAALRAGG